MRFKHNFSAGPGALPETVLKEAQSALDEAPGTGLSLLGISHRSSWFRDVVSETEAHFRALLDLPANYHVLFLQGGGTQQFSQIPMTLLRGASQPAEYLHTGYWSDKSIPEARREGPVKVLWSGASTEFRRLPADAELATSPSAPYFHYVSNETVEGLQFHRVPGDDRVLRVCDMSSDFLSHPLESARFGILYAHAQKNLGPAGVTVVVIRDDIVQATPADLPSMLDYRLHAEARSIYNTPPVFAIYVTLLVVRWLRQEIGGLAQMAEINAAKASLLYDAIDASEGYYRGRAAVADRSLMNVVFNLPDLALEHRFVEAAAALGICGLEGHRSIGGLRASIYNAVTLESAEVLARFMQSFHQRNHQPCLP
jgi:phosphoserine aminotransferase